MRIKLQNEWAEEKNAGHFLLTTICFRLFEVYNSTEKKWLTTNTLTAIIASPWPHDPHSGVWWLAYIYMSCLSWESCDCHLQHSQSASKKERQWEKLDLLNEYVSYLTTVIRLATMAKKKKKVVKSGMILLTTALLNSRNSGPCCGHKLRTTSTEKVVVEWRSWDLQIEKWAAGRKKGNIWMGVWT